jgi:methionyl-tRNA formyltransferase
MARIIFMGTPAFSIPSLNALLEKTSYEIMVYTRPPQPKGRGLLLERSKIEVFAKEKKLAVFCPQSLKDAKTIDELRKADPEYIITCAYGLFLPKEVLTLPRNVCINIHPSLLPKYRGAAPINWALINGELRTGTTTIVMDEGMDTGDILLQKELDILPNDNTETLGERLAILSAQCLIETIEGLDKETLKALPQNHEEATRAPLLTKDRGKIDWHESAVKIHNLIRGLYPWPCAHTLLDGIIMKLFSSEVISEEIRGKQIPGRIIAEREDGIVVTTGNGNILIKEAQLPNKKRMKVSEIFKGYRGEKVLR